MRSFQEARREPGENIEETLAYDRVPLAAADRTACTKATANQFRLFRHAGAYWLLWALRAAMPKHSTWRLALFDPLRLRLVKIAARVVETLLSERAEPPHPLWFELAE